MKPRSGATDEVAAVALAECWVGLSPSLEPKAIATRFVAVVLSPGAYSARPYRLVRLHGDRGVSVKPSNILRNWKAVFDLALEFANDPGSDDYVRVLLGSLRALLVFIRATRIELGEPEARVLSVAWRHAGFASAVPESEIRASCAGMEFERFESALQALAAIGCISRGVTGAICLTEPVLA